MGADRLQPPTPGRVLLMVGSQTLARVVEFTLNHGTLVTRTAASAAEAHGLLSEWRPHLLLLDMDLEANSLLEQLGGEGSRSEHIPVIALTRRGDLKTKLAAFERGVDDILTVPFSPEELVARALAVMRRSYSEALQFTPVVRTGELEIDILNRRATVGGHAIHLTCLEQNLLYLLAANAGRLLSREEILDSVWGVDYAAESNVVDRHVRNLRIKLRDGWRRPHYIATVPGLGYRFLPTAEGSPPKNQRAPRGRRRGARPSRPVGGTGGAAAD